MRLIKHIMGGGVLALSLSLTGCTGEIAQLPAVKDKLQTKQTIAPNYQSGWISVTAIGQGPDVILIPGLASSASVWDGTVAEMKDQYRLHVVQVAGFAGALTADTRPSVIDGLTGDLSEYIKSEKLNNPVIVGHSLGGFTGLKMARDYSDEIGSAVIVDSLPFFSVLFNPAATTEIMRPQAQQIAAHMRGIPKADYDAMQRQNMRIYSKKPDVVSRVADWSDASDRETVLTAMTELMTSDMRPYLPKITTPINVIYAYDFAMGTSETEVVALYEGQYKGLENVDFTRIPNSFHFIMDDQPEAFYDALKTALKGNE